MEYGIGMQLPIYVYLVNKSNIFNNPKIIGFYLEQILFEKNSYDSKKDENEQRKDKLKLSGISIDDPYLVSMFDETYENSDFEESSVNEDSSSEMSCEEEINL